MLFLKTGPEHLSEERKRLKKLGNHGFQQVVSLFVLKVYIIIDVAEQKLAYDWALTWPSMEKGFDGNIEHRRGWI